MKISDLKNKFKLTKDWILEDFYAIGPYPTDSFFKSLIENFKPQNLFLFVDDGWPEIRVEKIRKQCNALDACLDVQRVTASPNGLVHAKIYFFKWKDSNQKYRRYLLVGSANASLQGFGAHAETYAFFWIRDFSDDKNNKALTYIVEDPYFYPMRKGESVPELELKISDYSWISLPAINVVGNNKSSFDAWLRRGRICHKYEPEQSFGKFQIDIVGDISGDVQAALEEAGLAEAKKTTRISDPYIKFKNFSSNEKEENYQWKAKFFIETNLGFWVAEDCYTKYHDSFKAKSFNARKLLIDEIKSLEKDQSKIDNIINEFIAKIQSAFNKIKEMDGINIKNYFLICRGELNEKRYRKICKAKIDKDIHMAKDKEFARRFIDGFEFSEFPSIDDQSFERFSLSFCRELLLEREKINSRCLLMRSIEKANLFKIAGNKINKNKNKNIPMERYLFDEIRDAWSKENISSYWII